MVCIRAEAVFTLVDDKYEALVLLLVGRNMQV